MVLPFVIVFLAVACYSLSGVLIPLLQPRRRPVRVLALGVLILVHQISSARSGDHARGRTADDVQRVRRRTGGSRGRGGRRSSRLAALPAPYFDLADDLLVVDLLFAHVVVLHAIRDRLALEVLGDLAELFGVEDVLLLEDVLLRVGPRVEEFPLL